MFECVLPQGDLFRKLVNAIQDLVTDGNFAIDSDQISFQGMDSSHVSLVSMMLESSGFQDYRCDRDLTLGINFASLGKILKCMGNKDTLSLRAEDDSDNMMFVFESENQERISNFSLKLMDIESEQLGIPDTDYSCVIQMPSVDFQRICRDLSAIGDTVTISATKEGVRFSVSGDIGSGDMSLKQTKSCNADSDKENDEDNQVLIQLEEPVTQTFALRYLNNFTKATQLAKTVTLSLGTEVPLVTEYKLDNLGYVRYYLAPKIDDEDEN